MEVDPDYGFSASSAGSWSEAKELFRQFGPNWIFREDRLDPIGFSRLLSSESKGGRRVLKQSSLRSLMPSVGKHTTTSKPPRYRRADIFLFF
jgi:hypothetical protein